MGKEILLQEKECELKLIQASDIEVREVEWLWYPFIPAGKVTIIQGDPGDGKSTFMLDLAARMSTGRSFPFEEEIEREPQKVIYQTTEDDADDTVVPRFLRAGGDPNNLLFIDEREKRITFADDRIAEAIKKTDAKMLILDPLSAYIGECSLNQANEVRPRFNYLIEAAREQRCAIVIVDHMNKNEQAKALYRARGTIDVVGAARSTLIIGRHPEQEDVRILVQQKSNLAPTGNAFSFSVGEEGITILEEMKMTADELLSGERQQIGRPSIKTEKAVEFIREMLSDGELHPASECRAELEKAGYHSGTIRRAKAIAEIESTKVGDKWYWQAPDRNQEVNKNTQCSG